MSKLYVALFVDNNNTIVGRSYWFRGFGGTNPNVGLEEYIKDCFTEQHRCALIYEFEKRNDYRYSHEDPAWLCYISAIPIKGYEHYKIDRTPYYHSTIYNR